MNHITSLLLPTATFASASAQITHTLVATDFQFDPLVLNINTGDTVRITLNTGHSFREVTQTTWELSGALPAIGWDFDQALELTVHDLVTTTPGTIYYVCPPHVDMGMKGRIVVTQGTIVFAEGVQLSYRIHPSPTTGMVRMIDAPEGAVWARVLDATGRVCFERTLAPGGQIDLRALAPGWYNMMLLDPQGSPLTSDRVMLQDL